MFKPLTREDLKVKLFEIRGEIKGEHVVRVGQHKYFDSVRRWRFYVFGSTSFLGSPWDPILANESSSNEVVYIDCTTKRVDTNKLKERASNAFEDMKDQSPQGTNEVSRGSNSAYSTIRKNTEERQVVVTPQKLKSELFSVYKLDHDPVPVNPTKNAMTAPWGKRNYVNPPFKYASGFLLRACDLAKSSDTYSVFLVPSPFKNLWFREIVLSGCVQHITFLRHGLSFDGYKNTCPVPLILIHIGPRGAVLKDGSAEIPCSFYDPVPRNRRLRSHKIYEELPGELAR